MSTTVDLSANGTDGFTIQQLYLRTKVLYPSSENDISFAGIAISSLDATNGTWEYKLSSGSFTAFPAVVDTSSILLDFTSSIRFVANSSYTGSPTFAFVGWDGSGTVGGTADITDPNDLRFTFEAYEMQLIQIASAPTITTTIALANYKKCQQGNLARHTLVIGTDNKIYAAGRNAEGQLGIGSTSSPTSFTAVTLAGGKTPIAVATGFEHSIALCSDGTVQTWGLATDGRLGNGQSSGTYTAPVQITLANGKKAKSISVGFAHNGVVCTDGTIQLWGSNSNGRCGTGASESTSPSFSTPQAVTVPDGKTAVELVCCESFTILRCTDGSLYGCGYSGWGMLRTTTVSVNSFIAIDINGKQAVQVNGGNRHTAVLCSDGTVYTWGNQEGGRLGNGSTSAAAVTSLTTPTIAGGKTPVFIGTGSEYTIIVCSDGTIQGFGIGNYGQLGIGSIVASPTSISVPSGKIIVAAAGGDWHTVLLCSDGSILTAGNGSDYRLGTGSTTSVETFAAISQTYIYSTTIAEPATYSSPTLTGGPYIFYISIRRFS